jgi:hypothetical protein
MSDDSKQIAALTAKVNALERQLSGADMPSEAEVAAYRAKVHADVRLGRRRSIHLLGLISQRFAMQRPTMFAETSPCATVVRLQGLALKA